ncbi:MAG: hypothetical protein VB023_09695 [Oscillibacter sp.]|nr:hypothetical protein [Oscillibacter sp.]
MADYITALQVLMAAGATATLMRLIDRLEHPGAKKDRAVGQTTTRSRSQK